MKGGIGRLIGQDRYTGAISEVDFCLQAGGTADGTFAGVLALADDIDFGLGGVVD